MHVKPWILLVGLSMSLFCCQVRAGDCAEKPRSEPSQESRELRQLIVELTARLEKIEQRLAQLEGRPGESVRPVGPMTPLGSHLKVDATGVIWDGDRPVGLWGINHGEGTSGMPHR